MDDWAKERATDVILSEDSKPVLYDHRDRPLKRSVGFRMMKESKPEK